MDKADWFILGMLVGGIVGIVIHAYITGTLFVQ
jgi:gas vesicle protein